MGIDAAVAAIGDAVTSAVASAPVVDAGTALAATAPAAFGDAAAGAAGDALAAGAGDAIAGGAADALGGAAADTMAAAPIDAVTSGDLGPMASSDLPWLQPGYVNPAASTGGYSVGDILSPSDANIMNGGYSTGQTMSPADAAAMNSSTVNSPLAATSQNTAQTVARMAPGASNVANAAGGATQGASTLATIAKLAPLISQVAGQFTNMPNALSQKQVQQQQSQLAANQQQLNQGFETALNAGANNGPLRTQVNPNVNYSTYGQGPQQSFFNNINPAITFPNVQTTPVTPLAKGGPVSNANSNGDGGQSDTIPAQLSEGEFVVPADAVSSLGDGNTNAGAGALQRMVKGVRMHKSSGKGGLPPKAKSPLQYMAAGGLPRPYPVHLRGNSSFVGG